MIDVASTYQSKYVPYVGGKPVPTLVYGDQLTCERLQSAKGARINGRGAAPRLDGIVPAVTDWHLRKLLLQVPYNAASVNKFYIFQ